VPLKSQGDTNEGHNETPGFDQGHGYRRSQAKRESALTNGTGLLRWRCYRQVTPWIAV